MRSLTRSHPAHRATVVISAAALLALTTSAQATSFTTAAGSARVRAHSPTTASTPIIAAAVSTSSPSGTGASDVSNLGSEGWEVQSSAVATQSGAQISTPGFNTTTWLPVANDDAGAPGTEIEALAQNGKCPGDTALQPVNPSTDRPRVRFSAANMRNCYGFMNAVGADTVARFRVPWWWHTDFMPNLRSGHVATLIVNGVIGSANVWVNGREVATSATVTGAYTRFRFNITHLVAPGTNVL